MNWLGLETPTSKMGGFNRLNCEDSKSVGSTKLDALAEVATIRTVARTVSVLNMMCTPTFTTDAAWTSFGIHMADGEFPSNR